LADEGGQVRDDRVTFWTQILKLWLLSLRVKWGGEIPYRGAAGDSTSRNHNSLALSYGQGCVTKRMLARHLQLTIKTFVNCFGVFALGKNSIPTTGSTSNPKYFWGVALGKGISKR
jgi:hypothetical protein